MYFKQINLLLLNIKRFETREKKKDFDILDQLTRRDRIFHKKWDSPEGYFKNF